MSTSPVNSTTNPTGGLSNAQSQQALNSNYANFLQLLTTQLQNQDPTSPTDTNQLTQEIASLSQVQQQIDTNNELQQLVSLFTASATNNAVSYIGKQIDATPAAGTAAQTELTNSQATLVYDLPAGASSATVTITDSVGNTVFSGPGTTIAGRNQVVWKGGTNPNSSGTSTTAPDGTYNFTVNATDSSGKTVTATTMTSGTVTAVDTQNGTATLSLGGTLSVPLSNVQTIYNAGTDPTS